MTSSFRPRIRVVCQIASLIPTMACLVLQAPVALAITQAPSLPASPMAQGVKLAQWANDGSAILPQLPSTGSGSDWPGPGMRQQGLPSLQDYNRIVNHWIRRTGPMGVDRCTLSGLFRTHCD